LKVCVIGAGIVGCATAYQFAKLGCDVHLVEAAQEPGTLTSFANGAQLSYSYVEPFASPATLRALPGMLLSRDSPVTFRLKADWRQWAWGASFLRACTASQTRRGTVDLLELARLSRHTLSSWMESERWSFSFAESGKLVLCPDLATLRRQEAQVRFQAAFGCKQQILTARECLEREPALHVDAGQFEGGIWTPDECVGDPYLLCAELVRSIRRLGGTVSYNTRVGSFVKEDSLFRAVTTDQGDIHADVYVLAAGPHAAALAATFGLYLPIYPIKGYSITVPFLAKHRPKASVTDLGRKTVFAPLGSHLRVAAMAEIAGYALDVPAARVRKMIAGVEHLYPGMCDTLNPAVWAGLRPATPTSVPMIEQLASSNLYLNVGHGALGLTLAAGSAARLSSLVLGPPA
jgi:D-amino-acid dehydrogenase